MPEPSKNGMHCAEFESLLHEALDRTLTGAKLEAFQAHARGCAACGPMLADVDAGRRWLKSLDEVEPPPHLARNILLATTGEQSRRLAEAKGKRSWKDALGDWMRPVYAPALAMGRQPRFAMSFGMAFFSLSISLSLAGVKASDLRHLDLRPAAIKRAYYEATGKVVKYYENIRLVYEIESRVRQFQKATRSAEPKPKEPEKEKKEPGNNNTSGQPEQRQERNYSQGESSPVLAILPNEPPVVTKATYRRQL